MPGKNVQIGISSIDKDKLNFDVAAAALSAISTESGTESDISILAQYQDSTQTVTWSAGANLTQISIDTALVEYTGTITLDPFELTTIDAGRYRVDATFEMPVNVNASDLIFCIRVNDSDVAYDCGQVVDSNRFYSATYTGYMKAGSTIELTLKGTATTDVIEGVVAADFTLTLL